ncbi:hypothetical protein BDZ91DRAFT_751032 [Kalaharituber pfeilii]|nr:hypothetical protein BDZ91DRAFT_751032 [Kalaharituber pfeilii]
MKWGGNLRFFFLAAFPLVGVILHSLDVICSRRTLYRGAYGGSWTIQNPKRGKE